jgi:hypothetical protein
MTTLDAKLVDIVCDHQSVIRHGTFTTEEFADALHAAARAGAEAQRNDDVGGLREDGQHQAATSLEARPLVTAASGGWTKG